MEAYRLAVTVEQDGTVTLTNLPLSAGEVVEVILLVHAPASKSGQRYPLRGQAITYVDPMEPVALQDWDNAS